MSAFPNFSCSLILSGNGLPLSFLCGNPTDSLWPMSKPTSPLNISQFASLMQSEAPFPSWSPLHISVSFLWHLIFCLELRLVQYLYVCVCTHTCVRLCDAMHSSTPGSSVHAIFQERILEWVAMSSSRGSSRPRDWTLSSVSCIGRGVPYHWASWEALVQCLLFPYFRRVVSSI